MKFDINVFRPLDDVTRIHKIFSWLPSGGQGRDVFIDFTAIMPTATVVNCLLLINNYLQWRIHGGKKFKKS